MIASIAAPNEISPLKSISEKTPEKHSQMSILHGSDIIPNDDLLTTFAKTPDWFHLSDMCLNIVQSPLSLEVMLIVETPYCGQCAESCLGFEGVCRCGGCGNVWYCSQRCKVQHWRRQHRSLCCRNLLAADWWSLVSSTLSYHCVLTWSHRSHNGCVVNIYGYACRNRSTVRCAWLVDVTY